MPGRKVQFSQIQFHGEPGVTQPCLEAIIRLVHFGDKIGTASLLTHGSAHCFLLKVNAGDRVAIKSGFSSGYRGEGPAGLAKALQILERHGAEIEEYLVPESVIHAIDDSALRMRQLREIEALNPYRPKRWFDYVYAIEGNRALNHDHRRLNDAFPLTLPYAIIDSRIMDLALAFAESPDTALVSAYRRLETLVRQKAGLEGGTRVFSRAFQGDTPLLVWPEVDASEQKARAVLFDAIFRAYRNPRAHREPSEDQVATVREFLLLNELFLLEAQSVKEE